MADIIIVLILIVIAVFAIKQTKKHMHGESPCCGGGSGTVKKVKEKTFRWSRDGNENNEDQRYDL